MVLRNNKNNWGDNMERERERENCFPKSPIKKPNKLSIKNCKHLEFNLSN